MARTVIRQGSYKYQHDTDKDLIKMHVFPRVKALPEQEAEEDGGGDMPGDCARQIVATPLWQFKELVATNAPSFIQHKSLHKVMKGVAGRFEEMDAKLVNMQQLEPHETELFERGQDIGDKVSWLEARMETMIADGQLTAGEQVFMVAEFHAKVCCLSLSLFMSHYLHAESLGGKVLFWKRPLSSTLLESRTAVESLIRLSSMFDEGRHTKRRLA